MNRLITIPVSHYCEKARWALQRAGVPFFEEPHLQGFHYLRSFWVARNPTVPILVTPGGVLKESADIVAWASEQMPENKKLYPSNSEAKKTIETFELFLDETLGPAGRLWLYSYLLDHPRPILKYSKTHGVPGYEIGLLPFILPLFKPFAKRRLKWKTTSRSETKRTVDAVFDRVEMLLEGGNPFLFGDRFTAADLTFAALSAPLILPSNYGVALPGLSELPSEMAQQIERWRARPAGRYGLRLYHEFR